MKSHSVAVLLNRMEKAGLVMRAKAPRKKNQVRVILTEKGQQTYSRTWDNETVQIMCRIVSFLSLRKRQQLKAGLEELRDAVMGKLGIKTKPPFPWRFPHAPEPEVGKLPDRVLIGSSVSLAIASSRYCCR